MNTLSTVLSTGSFLVALAVFVYARGIDSAAAALSRETRRIVEELVKQLADVRNAKEARAPAELAARIGALEAALEVDRASHRRELGKLWGRVGADATSDGTPAHDIVAVDPEWARQAALLESTKQ